MLFLATRRDARDARRSGRDRLARTLRVASSHWECAHAAHRPMAAVAGEKLQHRIMMKWIRVGNGGCRTTLLEITHAKTYTHLQLLQCVKSIISLFYFLFSK